MMLKLRLSGLRLAKGLAGVCTGFIRVREMSEKINFFQGHRLSRKFIVMLCQGKINFC